MKPKTKFQKKVVGTSKKLPPISRTQIEWGNRNCFDHIGHRTAKGAITCTECGHRWSDPKGELANTLLGNECPNCKTHINVKTTRKRTFKDCEYMGVMTVCRGFQVFRYVMIKRTAKVGKAAEYTHAEVMQRWIAPDGKCATFARLRQCMGTCYYDLWIFTSPFELRSEADVYNRIVPAFIYPKIRLIPEIVQRGFKGDYHGLSPFDLSRAILGHTQAETLLKRGETQMLRYFDRNEFKSIASYWSSLRICFRNRYEIRDISQWCDYIDLLRRYGKDLTNARYVCPDDLKAEHDRYVAKRNKEQEERRETERIKEEQRRQLAEENLAEKAKKFYGLQFSDGRIVVRVLSSIEEYEAEGKAMHHCVGGYYNKLDSLIFSATIDGKRIETVEVSLKKLEVVQCYGVCNKPTDHHDEIIRLVGDNMRLIKKRMAA